MLPDCLYLFVSAAAVVATAELYIIQNIQKLLFFYKQLESIENCIKLNLKQALGCFFKGFFYFIFKKQINYDSTK